MSEVGQAKLEDSNCAGLGSKEDHDLRKKAAATDPNLRGCGKKVGLEVWRVENKRTSAGTPDFGVRRVPVGEYGHFYSGDSYIALWTYKAKDEKGKETDKLLWNVHFWLGKESSQDEIGVAAYKTVEIDDLLDDGPVQYRETQGNESQLFKSYFSKTGIVYMKGGHASGFRHIVPDSYEPRLFIIHHKSHTTQAVQIPVAAKNLDAGAVCVLDAGLKVYLWIGDQAKPFAKAKGATMQHNIVASRMGHAKKTDLDEDFWKILGGCPADVRAEGDPYPLEEHEQAQSHHLPPLDRKSLELYRMVKVGKSMEWKLEGKENLKWKMLDSADVFIVNSNLGLVVWIGSGASKEEKSSAMFAADHFIDERKLSKSIHVKRVTEDKGQDKECVLLAEILSY